MQLPCYCGEGFELHYKLRKQLAKGFDLFCSGECLLKYIVDNGFADTGIHKDRRIYPSEMGEPFNYWCPVTRRFYRSKTESLFAIFCVYYEIPWRYEPYQIRLTKTKSYNPDFWLPDHSIFVEVKGVWSGAGKKKLKMTAELGYHVILVPDFLLRKIKVGR